MTGFFLPAGFPLRREDGSVSEALRNETEVLFSEVLTPGTGYLVPLSEGGFLGTFLGRPEFGCRRVFVAAKADEEKWREQVKNFLDAGGVVT